MNSPVSPPTRHGAWTSLWVVAALSLLGHLWLCQFFSFGEKVPLTIDVDPSNLWKLAYHFPPTGSFQVLNWLGNAFLPQPLTPLSLAAGYLPIWWFFTLYAPLMATLALLAMAAFLRDLDLPRPAALFGGVVFAWQGDIVPFVLPGHYAYMTAWPFYALAAWGSLRAQRTGGWAYAVISGASCGIMVALPTNTDRGGIASLLVAALYAAPILGRILNREAFPDYLVNLRDLFLCVATAFLIALAPLMALFQSDIVGVKLSGGGDREQTYKLVTQFSLGPEETLTYLVPGFYGWHINNRSGPYWGWIGETVDYPRTADSTRNLNLAISTTGTVATLLALIGVCVLVTKSWLGPSRITERQRFYGRVLLALGTVALILSWGWHTPFYRPLFALPLMDKWRNPLKWLELTNFALVVLSAYGAQHLLSSLEAGAPGTDRVRRGVFWFNNIMLAVLGLGFLASYPGAFVLAVKLQAESYAPREITAITSTLHTALLWALVVAALSNILLYGLWQPGRLRGWTLENPWLNRLWQEMLKPESLGLTLALGLAALSVSQLGWVTSEFVEPWPLAALTETNPLLEALRSEGPTVRVSVENSDPLLNNLLQNQFAADGISCLDISAASRIPDDLNTFFNTLDGQQERLWFLAGVKNVAIPEESLSQLWQNSHIAANMDRADGYTLQPTASPSVPSHALVVMKDYLAKATFVPKAEFFASDQALLDRLKNPAWNPRASVLLTGSAAVSATQAAASSNGSGRVELNTYTPTEIDIEVHTTQKGYVLINDQFDPDWHAQVNGHDAELLRADYIMRAIEVQPGDSTITLRYAAHYHVAGHNLSAEAMNNFSDGAMLIAWLVAGFALWRKRLG